MSILIKGMEMPTSCGDCPIGDSLCCTLMPGVPALWKEYTIAIRTNKRHSHCPLIPVPPHGRLIDLDAIPKEAWRGAKEDLVDELILAPTIIPAEEGE